MRTTIRLTIRQHRFVLVTFLVLAAIVVASAFLGAAGTAWVQGQAAACGVDGVLTPECERLQIAYLGAMLLVDVSGSFTILIACGAGVLLGVPLVSDELERGTAYMPWTMAPSRRGWLLRRIAIIGSVLLAVGLVMAVATDTAFQARSPFTPIGASLNAIDVRGWLVPVRMLLAFMAGVFAGAFIGRSLPSLIAGGALALALILSVQAYTQASLYAEPSVLLAASYSDADYQSDSRQRDPDGRVWTYQELYDTFGNDQPDTAAWEQLSYGVPGTRSPEFVGRALAIHGVELVLLLVGSVLIVERRRPYLT